MAHVAMAPATALMHLVLPTALMQFMGDPVQAAGQSELDLLWAAEGEHGLGDAGSCRGDSEPGGPSRSSAGPPGHPSPCSNHPVMFIEQLLHAGPRTTGPS